MSARRSCSRPPRGAPHRRRAPRSLPHRRPRSHLRATVFPPRSSTGVSPRARCSGGASRAARSVRRPTLRALAGQPNSALRIGPISDFIRRQAYTTAYDRRNRIPAWTAEHLTAASLKKPPAVEGGKAGGDRSGSTFKEDESIPSMFRAHLLDYFKSGYGESLVVLLTRCGGEVPALVTLLGSNGRRCGQERVQCIWSDGSRRAVGCEAQFPARVLRKPANSSHEGHHGPALQMHR